MAGELTAASSDALAPPGYPFSAIVGQDRLRLALTLCAVHTGIGGVLVRGEKGTAKSTVVRALAALMPPVPVRTGPQGAYRPARLVELPVGATEDRVVGSIDVQRILRDGEHAFSPGLLSAAHDGILYVDEVNLLHDHLVDLLLDSAAMGRVHVERDGISHSYPSRFLLVGTMNPEEGELRPQLLDRFGLAVDVAASREVDVRVEVIRRRLGYEHDPVAFAASYATDDAAIADAIAAARTRLPAVALSDLELRRIAALCASFDVDGMRADLVVARTAVAHAAWRGATSVAEEDVRVAAELALPHRRRRDPFDAPGVDESEMDEKMREAAEHAEPDPELDPDPTPGGSGPSPNDGAPAETPPAETPPAETPPAETPPAETPSGTRSGADSTVGMPSSRFATRLLEVPGIGEGVPGRRSRSRTSAGRSVRPTVFTGSAVHLVGTVVAAVERSAIQGVVKIAGADLRGAIREGREGNLVVFVVDTSGSMAARDRLSAVTGAVVSLLRDAYQRRDKVAVIAMRGSTAEIVLPPTSSVDIAVARLRDLRTGGRTPLAAGLLRARELVIRERARDRRRRPLMVVLTDGRATGGPDPVGRARIAAALVAVESVASVVVDCEAGMVRLGLAREIALVLGAAYISLPDLSSDRVAGIVRAAA